VAAPTSLRDPLRHRDFRVLWTGLTVSLVGDGIMLVALAWQVLVISSTPATLAVVGVAMSTPYALLALPGGVVSDRFDRRRVMIGADLVRALALVALGTLSISGRVHVWHLVVLAAAYGAGSAFFAPAFDATVPDLVPDDVLPQANALDQFIRPLALRLAGPMLGGILVGTLGAGWAFTADAATFVLSIVCVSMLRPVAAATARTAGTSALADIRECYRFVRAHTWLWATLLSSSVACLLFLGPSEVLLPFLVKHEMHASAGTLGAVLAFGGLGAVSAAMFVGRRGLPARYITFMYAAWTASTIAVAVYGFVHLTWQLMAACFAFNLFESAGLIVWATTKQRLVPRALLGRVSSLDWFVATGLTPISFALVGPAAAVFGARATLIASGLLASAVTGAAYFIPGLRSPEQPQDAEAAPQDAQEELFTLMG
jgi:MFS family permease